MQHERSTRLDEALADAEHNWIAVRPGQRLPAALRAAVAHFTAAGDSSAARSAERWLRESALVQQSAVTWLAVGRGRVLGFSALASAEVALTNRARREVGSGYRRTPATLVAWLAKAEGDCVDGEVILRHAVAMARRVALVQGNLVLAVDAFDGETESMWRKRFGFRTSAPPLEDERPPARARLWIPLASGTSDQ